MCEKYIIGQYDDDVKTLSDVPWGGGWTAFKKEFENTLRELTYLGYGIVFIAHSKSKPTKIKDAEGEPITSVYPDITSTGMSVVNRLVDVISYLSEEFIGETSNRYLCTRKTPYIFAGSRYPYLKEKIPFGYQQLVDSIADAIEEQVRRDGAEVTDHTVLKKSFETLIEEAKEMWVKLTTDDKEDTMSKTISEIVKTHLGKEARISEIIPSQVDILEKIVEDMKKL